MEDPILLLKPEEPKHERVVDWLTTVSRIAYSFSMIFLLLIVIFWNQIDFDKIPRRDQWFYITMLVDLLFVGGLDDLRNFKSLRIAWYKGSLFGLAFAAVLFSVFLFLTEFGVVHIAP